MLRRRVAVASRSVRGDDAERGARDAGGRSNAGRARATTTTMSSWDVRARRDGDGDDANERATNERRERTKRVVGLGKKLDDDDADGREDARGD